MRPSYSWSRSPKRPKALRREHGGVEGFRILGPSRARGTLVAAQSHTPGLRRAGVRCMSGRALQHFCDILRCVTEPLHTAHAWQSQMDSYRDTDSARGQLTIWRQTTRVKRTHPDTKVHRKDSSGHLPPRARIRLHHEALLRREGKKGKDKDGLERMRAKHGLWRLYPRKAIRSTS
jgi:hypothetical protein